MINLNDYVIEKLHLNKDIKIKKDKYSEAKLFKALKRCGEVYLKNIFHTPIIDDKNMEILSLYVGGKAIYATYFDKEKKSDYEFEIYEFGDMFTEDECQELYDYILTF